MKKEAILFSELEFLPPYRNERGIIIRSKTAYRALMGQDVGRSDDVEAAMGDEDMSFDWELEDLDL